MRLNKELAFALKKATERVYPQMDAVAGVAPGEHPVDAVTRASEEPRDWSNWFDDTKIDESHPLRPIQTWDDSVPMKKDDRFDDWWEAPRKWFQKGPGTTSYDVSRYKPNGVGDYIIRFGGAGSGVDGATAGSGKTLGKAYGGDGRISSFTWNQIPEAITFIKSLPKGSRLFINGHSMGGAAALQLARTLQKDGIRIAGLDIRDPVRIDDRIGSHIRNLKGLTPFWKRPQEEFPSNVTYGTNVYNAGWFNGLNPLDAKNRSIGDIISFVGSRINGMKTNGNAFNIPVKGKAHEDIGAMDNRGNFPVDEEWLKQQQELNKGNQGQP